VTNDIVVIAPEATAGAGGVADYTLRLLEYFPDREQVLLLVPPLDLKQLPSAGGKVLVQYSAYGFDYLGYPRDLIRGLIDWKRKTHGRLVVMFHEIWAFWPVTNKNYFVQLFHRRAIKQLLQHVDVAFTSTAGQAERLHVLNPSAPVHLLPVGPNIRPMDLDLARERGTAVLFGLHRARIRALQRMESSLRALASSERITKLIAVGSNATGQNNQEEFRLLSSFRFGRGFEQRGAQSAEAISRLLSSASFGIFGQNESSLTKSGTFMAYAAHELNVLSDSGGPANAEPFCWLVAPGELIDGISQSELSIRAQRLRDWQERTCSWKIIAAKVAEALELPGHSPINGGRQ
jgi:hypothetical protein